MTNQNNDKPQGIHTPEGLPDKYTVGVDFAYKPDMTVHTVITKRDGIKIQGERRETNGNN